MVRPRGSREHRRRRRFLVDPVLVTKKRMMFMLRVLLVTVPAQIKIETLDTVETGTLSYFVDVVLGTVALKALVPCRSSGNVGLVVAAAATC
jgi:hypothetical protein